MVRVRGKHEIDQRKRAPVIIVISVLVVTLVFTLLPKPSGNAPVVAAADDITTTTQAEETAGDVSAEPERTMPISRTEMEDILAEDDFAEAMAEADPDFDAEDDVVLLNRFGGVVVEAPEKEQSEIVAENAFDDAAERDLWTPRPAPQVDGGQVLSAEAERLIAASGLAERLAALELPVDPTIEETEEALKRLGQIPVLVHDLEDGTSVTIGVHFGLVSSLHHTEYSYEAGLGTPVERNVYSLLIPHPQRMSVEAYDDVPEAALERLVCQEHPEMYYRAMLLVDYLVHQRTGHHIKIYQLGDPAEFSVPTWNAERISENACFGQS